MSIQDNTFAAACYNNNSINELEQALIDGPDKADMNEWGLSESDWCQQIILALSELKADCTRH